MNLKKKIIWLSLSIMLLVTSYKVNSPSKIINQLAAISVNKSLDPITYDEDAQSYYSSSSTTGIYENQTGDLLLSTLRNLNSENRKMTPGYKQLGNYYLQTDGDPNNPGNIIAFYSGKSVAFNGSFSGNVNREHVWPNSRGGSAVEGDLHMTRPTITSENGSRGNSFYVEGKKSSSGGWDPAMESFGLEKYRGISARIIFYCVIASNNLSLVDKDDDSAENKTMGKLSDLLKWNLEYGIDETETRRNSAAQEIQGNRNPFIDDRSLACRIWGSTSDATKEICENELHDDVVLSSGITIDKTSITLKVNETTLLNATIQPANVSNNNIIWSSDDESIASVNNGLVTANQVGSTFIKATTGDGLHSVTCQVEVTDNINKDYNSTIQKIENAKNSFKEKRAISNDLKNIKNSYDDALQSYNNLSVANQVKVTNFSTLNDCLEAYNFMLKYYEIVRVNINGVFSICDFINSNEVISFVEEYDSLNTTAKRIVDTAYDITSPDNKDITIGQTMTYVVNNIKLSENDSENTNNSRIVQPPLIILLICFSCFMIITILGITIYFYIKKHV